MTGVQTCALPIYEPQLDLLDGRRGRQPGVPGPILAARAPEHPRHVPVDEDGPAQGRAPESLSQGHPGNASITFNYIEGESILLLLDAKGIYVSTGSACSSTSLIPSHVLTALGVPVERIHGTVRFSIGDFTTKEDLDYVLDELKPVVTRLREISSISEKKGW